MFEYVDSDVLHVTSVIFNRKELLQRLDDTILLNDEYQRSFQKNKEKLRETPDERQFEFRSVHLMSKTTWATFSLLAW